MLTPKSIRMAVIVVQRFLLITLMVTMDFKILLDGKVVYFVNCNSLLCLLYFISETSQLSFDIHKSVLF